MASLPLADNTFEELLQDLPADWAEQARQCQALVRARVIKTPAQLLRLVLLYGGLDESLRTSSASSAQLGVALTDEAVRQRLQACIPWLTQLLQQMLPAAPAAATACGRRLIIVDGSVIQAPGAKTADYRLHLGWDWFRQQIAFLEVTTTKTAESLARFAWQAGDVALADRNFARAPGLAALTARQGAFIVRLQPTFCALQTLEGAPLALATELRAAPASAAVVTCAAQMLLDGRATPVWVHAYRLPEEAANRARQRCRRTANKQSRAMPKVATLFFFAAG